MANTETRDKAVLMASFAKIDPVALAIALGSIWGLMIFLATAVLLIRAAPAVGHIGPHLALLGIYLPGYEVTWAGATLGTAYFGMIGAVVGFVIAILWNLTHYLYIVLTVARAVWWKMMDE